MGGRFGIAFIVVARVELLALGGGIDKGVAHVIEACDGPTWKATMPAFAFPVPRASETDITHPINRNGSKVDTESLKIFRPSML